MTETEFRFKHSMLMEYYQYVEWRLKSLLSSSDIGTDDIYAWNRKFEEYNEGKNTLGKLFHMVVKEYDGVFTEEEKDDFAQLIENRNYWCHLAFGGNDPIAFKKKRGAKEKYVKPVHGIRLEKDLSDAIEWDEKLTNISCQLEKKE